MIQTTANFNAAASARQLEPIFRFSVDGYAKTYVYQPTGRANEYAWITSINDWGVSIDPQNGSYTIDDLVINVLDKNAAVTQDLSLLLLEGRRFTLQMGFAGLALADYCTLTAGIVNKVTSNDDYTYSFTCNDFNRLAQRVVYTNGNTDTVVTTATTYNASQPYTIVTQSAVPNSSGGITSSATVAYASGIPYNADQNTSVTTNGVKVTTVVTHRTTITNNVTLTVYEAVVTTYNIDGSVVTVTSTYGQFQLYTNVIATASVDSSSGIQNTTISVTFTENGTVGTVVLDDNAIISSSNPRRVVGHPLDMLLDILLNQVGFATSDVSVSQVQAYRDSIFTGVQFDFTITGSVDAKDFIENQLLKPLGGYMFPNAAGQICVGFAQPLPGGLTAVGAATPSNLTKLPSMDAANLVNVVTLRFDKDDAGTGTGTGNSTTGYLSEANTFYSPSIADITDLTGEVMQEAANNAGAVQGQLIIESDGMRSGFQGFLLAKTIAASIFAMYGLYNPTCDIETFWWPLFAAELGEFITLTHPLLPDRETGTLGISNRIFQVVKRSYNFGACTVDLTINDASGIKAFTAHRIAPTGKGAYTTVAAADQQRYMFMAGAGGKQSNGDASPTLG